MGTPKHNNLYPRNHEIYNFGRPFLGYHYYILGLFDLCPGVEKKIFKEKHQFNTLPQNYLGGGGVMKLKFFFLLSLHVPQTNWPFSSWEEDGRLQMPTHSKRARATNCENVMESKRWTQAMTVQGIW